MKLGISGAKIDIVVASGVLRVTVNPRQHWLWILSEAVLIVLFSRYAFRYWAAMPLMLKVFSAWGIGAAVLAWFYQLSGSEVIELDTAGIRIRKDILGWEKFREFRIEDCRSLEPHAKGDGDEYGLRCRVGWRTVRKPSQRGYLYSPEGIARSCREARGQPVSAFHDPGPKFLSVTVT
jgi:hypothetical protein